MKYVKDEYVTLLSKGRRYSEYSDSWIDETSKGDVTFLKIIKIGKIYIYGQYVYKENGEIRTYNYNEKYLSKYKIEDYVLLKGLRWEFEEDYNNFRNKLNKHEEDKRKNELNIKDKLYKVESKLKNEWYSKNPSPRYRSRDEEINKILG